MKLKLCLLFVCLFSAIGIAQNGINYKALIKDNNGNVISNQSIDIQFSILQASTVVYEETHNLTTNQNGLAITNIGEGTVISGDFNAIEWASDDHFLNVQVNTGSGLVDLGTTQFMAVPYAMSSKDNYWTKSGTDIYTSNNEVGINSVNPEHTLDVRSSSQTEASQLNISNNDKSRYMRFFSGSETFPDPSMTWAPSNSLLFATFNDNTFDFQEKMRISSDGDIGIGINNPEARLDILGGDWNLDVGNPGDLRIGNSTNNFRIGVATGGGGAGVTRMYTNSNDLILGTNDTPVLKLNQNGSITAPSMTNNLIETAGNKSLITKEYADNLILNNSVEKTISIPATAFNPSINPASFRISNGVKAYYTESNHLLCAPITLPKGTVIHEISAYILDNDPINNLKFSIGYLFDLASNTPSLVFPALSTVNSASGVQILTHSNNFTISPTSQYSIRISPSTGGTWNEGMLAVLQVKITYTEP